MKALRTFKLAHRGAVLLGVMMMVMLLASCGFGKAGDVKESSETGGQGITSEKTDGSQSQDYVTIHRGQTFGQVNPSLFGTFDSAKEVEAFDQALRTAIKMPGIMNVVEPEYDVEIHYKGKITSIHLWLEPDSKRGMFTYITDTGTGYQLTDQSTAQLTEFIGQLRYSPDQAKENGDVVFTVGGIANREIWDKFVTEVKKEKAASVQLTTYTKEGSPIFNNLEYGYQGEFIRHRFDTTHDPMGMPLKSVEFCKELVAAQTEQGVEYRLNGCGEGHDQESETFHVLFPVDDAK